MLSVVVLQARTNSSRLPGKVLLPIAGIPLVVLAARRAGNTGRTVIVATSDQYTDDGLVNVLIKNGVSYFRGSLENTLQRVVDALSQYSDDVLVFRLTADNVFPDGHMLEELEADYLANNHQYLGSSGPSSGLPYGVSAELMQLSTLRDAARCAVSKFDQEHVTPYIRRKYGDAGFTKYAASNKAHYRATVDCLDDYVDILKVFEGIEDPVNEPLQNLITRLEGGKFQPVLPSPARKMVLGTAQFGMDYGISNKTGQPSQSLATTLIRQAIANGVTSIDTARVYGDSESVICTALSEGWHGRAQIITKLGLLTDCPEDASPEVARAFVESSIFRSCRALGVKKLDVVLLHRAEHLHLWNGAVWQYLEVLAEEGVIGRLGVSIQNPDELNTCLNDRLVAHIQMPFNILDWRWEESISAIEVAKRSRNLVVHTRSALLQGLLTECDPALWCKAGLREAEPVIRWLESERKTVGADTVAALCLGYCLAQPWIDGVVTGVESEQQLSEDLLVSVQPAISTAQLAAIVGRRPIVDGNVLNPATWQRVES